MADSARTVPLACSAPRVESSNSESVSPSDTSSSSPAKCWWPVSRGILFLFVRLGVDSVREYFFLL
jgi:hypothetical protein